MRKNERGITLIALIITVIVLLILAGVAMGIAINGGDIFGKASQARDKWNTAVASEDQIINNALQLLDEASLNEFGIKMTLRANNEETGTQVTLTRENFAEYLGKIVVNYTGPSSATNEEGTFIVPTVYRLFWIDWDNKYKDGEGTIYLKAESTGGQSYKLCDALGNLFDGNPATSKIQQLNPEMFRDGVTSPTSTNANMKAVRWLTDTAKWTDLINSTYNTKTNYVVASPSVEMMIDSFNTHYAPVLTGINSPDYSDITAGERRKLFYRYNSGEYGYEVGPNADKDLEYYTYTSDRSVYNDENIDYTYYPSGGIWLASPSAKSENNVMNMTANFRRIYM